MIDWKSIKAEYVTGAVTYGQLAERHLISKRAVEDEGKRGKWVQARRDYRQRVVDRVMEKKSIRDAEKLQKLIESADALVGFMTEIAGDRLQFFRQQIAIPQKNEKTKRLELFVLEGIGKKADMKAFMNATRALNELTKAIRNLYDLPTGEEQRKQELEERRLKLQEKQGSVNTGECGVIVIPEIIPVDPNGGVEVEE